MSATFCCMFIEQGPLSIFDVTVDLREDGVIAGDKLIKAVKGQYPNIPWSRLEMVSVPSGSPLRQANKADRDEYEELLGKGLLLFENSHDLKNEIIFGRDYVPEFPLQPGSIEFLVRTPPALVETITIFCHSIDNSAQPVEIAPLEGVAGLFNTINKTFQRKPKEVRILKTQPSVAVSFQEDWEKATPIDTGDLYFWRHLELWHSLHMHVILARFEHGVPRKRSATAMDMSSEEEEDRIIGKKRRMEVSPDAHSSIRDDMEPADELVPEATSKRYSAPRVSGKHANNVAALVINSTVQRKATVEALYARLDKYHFILVRGTPASGKSTLAQLLFQHIQTVESSTPLVLFNSWNRDGPHWTERLTMNGYPLKAVSQGMYSKGGVIIIDEAQLTYWDENFWIGFLKSLTETQPHRIILFVSYGSPTGAINQEVATPTLVSLRQRISLRPVNHDDKLPEAGLFLLKEEYDDLVRKMYARDDFTSDLLDYIYAVTSGHVGAATDLLRIVVSNESCRQARKSRKPYSLDLFQRIPMHSLWASLDSTNVFRRGLPFLEQLRHPNINRVFYTVIRKKYVTDAMFEDPADKNALQHCFKSGWLHATGKKPGEDPKYIFSTRLHEWFIEYHLGFRPAVPIQEKDLLSFAIKVIEHFSRKQLSAPRTLSVAECQRPPEAHFQDEFYRCCYDYTVGSLTSFPEYGYATGRVDLYLPSQKWGVELLRDGDRLEHHHSRFVGTGAYAHMDFRDYIILDFRQKMPVKAHPEMQKLYHVVFDSNYHQVQILSGSSLGILKEFALLN